MKIAESMNTDTPYFQRPSGIHNLKMFVGGSWLASNYEAYSPVFDPNTGELIYEAPRCLTDEVITALHLALTSITYERSIWASTCASGRSPT